MGCESKVCVVESQDSSESEEEGNRVSIRIRKGGLQTIVRSLDPLFNAVGWYCRVNQKCDLICILPKNNSRTCVKNK